MPEGGEHDLRGIVRTAASHRELVSMLLLQGREDQIEQYTDMSTNERIIQESMSRHMPQTTVMGKSGTTVRDDEAIWETARLRTKVSSLESEKAVLQENMRKTMNHVADLKSQVVELRVCRHGHLIELVISQQKEVLLSNYTSWKLCEFPS